MFRTLHRVMLRHRRRRQVPILLLQELAPKDIALHTLIHVGAHVAQERHQYEALGYRDVLWIEGSPSVHQRLAEVVREHSLTTSCRHRTLCALMTDRDGAEADLREYSNDGMSSSIFGMSRYGLDRWHLHETGVRERVKTRTLDSVAEEFGLLNAVDTLVVDVQGAELLVLKGAERVLKRAHAVIAEVSTLVHYEGGVLFPELRDFLLARGFVSMSTPRRHGDMLFLRDYLLT